MERIELSREEKEKLINSLKRYFMEEREEEIGDLAARLLLDYIANEIGPYFYNQGLRDAHKYISDKLEDLYGLEIYPR